MDAVWFILIGLCAGWLAGQIMGAGSYGLVGDVVVGVIGRSWAELKGRSELIADLRRKGRQDTITLVYAARDEEHKHALALKRYLNRSK